MADDTDAENTREIILNRTVNFGGTYYEPGTKVEFPEDIADELIDSGAADPVLVVQTKKKSSRKSSDKGGE